MKNWEDKIFDLLFNKLELYLAYALVFCAVIMFGGHIYRMVFDCNLNFMQFVYLAFLGVIMYFVGVLVKVVKRGQKKD